MLILLMLQAVVADVGGLYAYMTSATVLRVTLSGVALESLLALEFRAVFGSESVHGLLQSRIAGADVSLFGSMRIEPSSLGFDESINVQCLCYECMLI